MFDLFNAVNYLHSQTPPIIHRDIKPENVLFYKNGLKLGDFGWSSLKDRVRTTFCGTPDYLAPEMIVESGHNEKLDVWTLGILMYELIIGYAPFTPKKKLKDKREVQKQLEKNILKDGIDFPEFISSDAKDLISLLLQKKPKHRPSCRRAMAHRWFRQKGLVYRDPSSAETKSKTRQEQRQELPSNGAADHLKMKTY